MIKSKPQTPNTPNTRCSVLESRVKQLESKEGDYKQNFTKLFEALQDIKVEIAKLSLAKK